MNENMGMCPDRAACHHECAAGSCWRVLNAGPLSGVYPRDVWPARLVAAQRVRAGLSIEQVAVGIAADPGNGVSSEVADRVDTVRGMSGLPSLAQEVEQLRASVARHGRARAEAEAERDGLRSQLRTTQGKVESVGRQLDEQKQRNARLQSELDTQAQRAAPAMAAVKDRDQLAAAVAEAAQKVGIYNGETPLTGPHLLLLLADMVALIADQKGELARHHADFAQWEAMAAAGAGKVAEVTRLREMVADLSAELAVYQQRDWDAQSAAVGPAEDTGDRFSYGFGVGFCDVLADGSAWLVLCGPWVEKYRGDGTRIARQMNRRQAGALASAAHEVLSRMPDGD